MLCNFEIIKIKQIIKYDKKFLVKYFRVLNSNKFTI